MNATTVQAAAADATYWQGIHCGPWPLAFNYGWSRAVVETFSIVRVPKSPAWLVGATSVEGQISPVVDLALFFDATARPAPMTKLTRLLVGGVAGDGVNETMAFVFSGLPEQLSTSEPRTGWTLSAPTTLTTLGAGFLANRTNEIFLCIDVGALIATLSDAIA